MPSARMRRGVHRPYRIILLDPGQIASSPLWEQLTQQVQHVQQQLPQRVTTTGVNQYLRMGARADVPLAQLFPEDTAQMSLNLQRFMVDVVLSYPYMDPHTSRQRTKSAVQVSTSKRYMEEVARYYDEVTGRPHKLHLNPAVKAFVTHLQKSLPGTNCQKSGLTSATLKEVVGALRVLHGNGSVQEAVMVTAWTALMRPGECVVTPRYPQWDVSRHLAPQDNEFYEGEARRWPGDGRGVPPRMKFVIKDSKTEHFRLTSKMVVGRTGDPMLCAVRAMWQYMELNAASLSPASALFVLGGKPYSYDRLVGDLHAGLLASGCPPSEVRNYAGHSFRVGGAQVLALASYSLPYIMALGRWKCVESVLTYVKPTNILRVRDARAMAAAPVQLTVAQARRQQAQVAQAQAVSAASSQLRTLMMPGAPHKRRGGLTSSSHKKEGFKN